MSRGSWPGECAGGDCRHRPGQRQGGGNAVPGEEQEETGEEVVDLGGGLEILQIADRSGPEIGILRGDLAAGGAGAKAGTSVRNAEAAALASGDAMLASGGFVDAT